MTAAKDRDSFPSIPLVRAAGARIVATSFQDSLISKRQLQGILEPYAISSGVNTEQREPFTFTLWSAAPGGHVHLCPVFIDNANLRGEIMWIGGRVAIRADTLHDLPDGIIQLFLYANTMGVGLGGAYPLNFYPETGATTYVGSVKFIPYHTLRRKRRGPQNVVIDFLLPTSQWGKSRLIASRIRYTPPAPYNAPPYPTAPRDGCVLVGLPEKMRPRCTLEIMRPGTELWDLMVNLAYS